MTAEINLTQLGLNQNENVTLQYEIKDFDGKIYYSNNETANVMNTKSLTKEFPTSTLAPGDYVAAVMVFYSEGEAVASSQFKVVKGFAITKTAWIIIGIVVLVLIIIAGVWWYIRRRQGYVANNQQFYGNTSSSQNGQYE